MTLNSSLRARDADNDGVLDRDDNCEYDPNPAQTDSDGNGVGDDCELNEWGFALATTRARPLTPPAVHSQAALRGILCTISRYSAGSYAVDFPGLGTSSGGNVQVAAFGDGSERL